MKRLLPVVALVVVAAGGCLGTPDAPGSTSSTGGDSADGDEDSFPVLGSITVEGEGSRGRRDSCRGSGGYDDMFAGAQVTVYNAAGRPVALGALEPGASVGTGGADCLFEFMVPGVPAGEGIYSIEVSHRGEINFTEEDARRGAIDLTLG